ncbi:DUF6542 domain-containing protein [Streptomyces sp. NPDC050516]|uniref:DUF6542 domain-containing protein n=1 Tax=Streptomyces sp. NPDC050516 TaxID=3365621 RepID=UPI003790D036
MRGSRIGVAGGEPLGRTCEDGCMQQRSPAVPGGNPPHGGPGGGTPVQGERPPRGAAVGHRPGPARGRGPTRAALALALVVPPLAGACVDAVGGSGSGWGLLVGGVVGAAASAVLGVRRKALSWMAPLPALVVAALAAAVHLLTGPSSSGGKSTSTDLIRWAVAAFPAMAAAECTVLAVLAVRGLQSLRSRTSDHA